MKDCNQENSRKPAVWFPTIRAGSGADVFTERLVAGLVKHGIRSEITWLPHRTEYAPWTVEIPAPPAWANIVHVGTWLHPRFIPRDLAVVATMLHCVLDPALSPYKSFLQSAYHRLWVRPLERQVLARAAKVVAISRYTAERTRDIYGVENMEVNWIGIDLDLFRPGLRQGTHQPFRLLFIGNWSARKGVDLLAPIMEALGEGFELFILGGLRAAEMSGLPGNMRVVPRCADDEAMAKLYGECDALIFPSRLEGFGMVALEAQACGIPVIATDGSSLPEVVEHGLTGFLCERDNVAAFAAAARKLAADKVLWQGMSLAARAHAERNFGNETMIERYVASYRSVLDEASPDRY